MRKKKIWRICAWFLAAVLIVALGYAGYVYCAYYRVEDHLALTVSGNGQLADVQTNTEYQLLSYNVGFGAYSADYSFFMDGGKESRARSAQDVEINIGGAADTIAAQDPSFILLQEVDTDGTRSMHIDECELFYDALDAEKQYTWTFAQNYDSPYLFYPFNSPHGANQSGILTLSRFRIASSERRSLPVEESVIKILDLDRCYSVNHFAIDGSDKELILYNVHLSAYTSDGTIAIEQLKMLCADMTAEYEKGNYCIAGGDFNKDLLGNSEEVFGIYSTKHSTWAQPIPEGIITNGLSKIVPFNAENPVASCRTAGEPYAAGSTLVLTVDGFIVSDNVEVVASDVIDTGYAYSDHNPVYLDFALR